MGGIFLQEKRTRCVLPDEKLQNQKNEEKLVAIHVQILR